MISREDLESCVVYTYGSDKLFEWFINQDIIAFGLSSSDYSELYQNFIKEVIDLYEIERKDTFFFSGGKLVNKSSKGILYTDVNWRNNFKIDVNKLNSIIRNKKLEKILNN